MLPRIPQQGVVVEGEIAMPRAALATISSTTADGSRWTRLGWRRWLAQSVQWYGQPHEVRTPANGRVTRPWPAPATAIGVALGPGIMARDVVGRPQGREDAGASDHEVGAGVLPGVVGTH